MLKPKWTQILYEQCKWLNNKLNNKKRYEYEFKQLQDNITVCYTFIGDVKCVEKHKYNQNEKLKPVDVSLKDQIKFIWPDFYLLSQGCFRTN